jgi:hypothetical protein
VLSRFCLGSFLATTRSCRLTCCDECFTAAAKLRLPFNIWAPKEGDCFYQLLGDGTTALMLSGSIHPTTKKWQTTLREPTWVACGWGGLQPSDFGWRLGAYKLVSGIGIRWGGSIHPVHMKLPESQCATFQHSVLQ